jgi:hypothetical protein
MLWRGGGALKSDTALPVLRHITGIATKWNDSARVFESHPFWSSVDLENKLLEFRDYFSSHRPHHALERRTPDQDTRDHARSPISALSIGNLTVKVCIRRRSLLIPRRLPSCCLVSQQSCISKPSLFDSLPP